jgi:hypothetical protein
MQLDRFVLVLPAFLALAACGGGNPQPPATPAPTTQPAATVAQPAAPAVPGTPMAATPAAAVSDEALAPLMGNWAADLANCGTDLSISLSAEAFNGAENACTIASWNDNGDGTVTATLNCAAEGQQTTERIAMNPVFAPTGEGITLTYLDRGNEEATVLRCPAPRG